MLKQFKSNPNEYTNFRIYKNTISRLISKAKENVIVCLWKSEPWFLSLTQMLYPNLKLMQVLDQSEIYQFNSST